MADEGEPGRALAQWRRLAGPAALVALVAVGLAAAGSPGRLTPGDPAWWLAVCIVVASVAVVLWAGAMLLLRRDQPRVKVERAPVGYRVFAVTLLVVVVSVGIGWALSLLFNGGSGKPLPDKHPPPPPPGGSVVTRAAPSGRADFGPIIVVILGVLVLAGLAWVLAQRLRGNRQVAAVEVVPGDPLAAAVDAALLDLGNERDPRRAVIQAYARTEAVLRGHGLPRLPSEAPLEYLDRVLRELGARAAAVDLLTELFERAAFSQHPVGPEMRDEAVAAFHGLREDLARAQEQQT